MTLLRLHTESNIIKINYCQISKKSLKSQKRQRRLHDCRRLFLLLEGKLK